ncbi:MAG: succinate dehydrogenase / fumarate reductase, cytochrome b subunit [Phycisphaerales bacterium]|jgi:succinate dehydrogenase / fumarate reductase cytochrome b subunit|nr:succinate dehydrogenase / fumarate reductase, cytochrome b subunit [Phycisphaerales bacterium]
MANSLRLAIRKYRWKYAGMLGFWIQRITGLALLAYLFLHVKTIHQLNDPQKFQAALDQFGQPLFKLGEIGLLAAVVAHSLNGIRITLVDAGYGVSKQRQMFWYLAIGVGAVIFIAGALPILIYTVIK